MFVVPEGPYRSINRTLFWRFYDFERTPETSDLAEALSVDVMPTLLSRWTAKQEDPMAAIACILIYGQHIIVMSVPSQRGRLYSEEGVYPDVDIDYSELIPRKVKHVRRTRKRAVER